MTTISRREFVRIAGLVGGGYALGVSPALAGHMGGGGSGGMGGSGTAVIDPPAGAALVEPRPAVNHSTDPEVVEVHLDCAYADTAAGGGALRAMTYNGAFIGETIRVRKDQMLRVRLRNMLPADGRRNLLGHPMYETNLHTHGLHVTPGDNMNADGTLRSHGDNVMITVPPGGEALYEYDLSMHPGNTINFYHPHLHGCVADQMWHGMAGLLLVGDEAGKADPLGAYRTRTMVLKDLTLSGGAPAPHDSMMDYMHGLEGGMVMVNGQVNPVVDIRPGEVQRWRFLNACTARFFKLDLTDHPLHVVGTDGGLLDKPYAFSDGILLSPGERLDVLVKAWDKAPRTASKLLSLAYSRQGNMGGQQVTLATLAYKGTRVSQALPATIDPSAVRDPSGVDVSMLPRKHVDLSMGQGRGYINGVSFTSMTETGSSWVHSMLGGWEVWEVTNSSGMDHPFHHHVNHAQVLSITGGDSEYRRLCTATPAWKDVTIVPKWGRVELLMPVMDYAGMTMMHCHIIEHEDIGMMASWMIMGDGGGMGDM